MSCKVLSIIGIILLVTVVQTHTAPEISSETYQNYDNFLQTRSKADDLLKKLKENVDSAIAKAQHALDVAEKKVKRTADKVQETAKKQLKSVGDTFRAEISKLKQKAKDAGVSIDDCLKGNEDRLIKLPNQLSDGMVHCISDKINEVISHARNVLNNIQKAVDEIANIKQNIKKCGHGIHSVSCLAKLVIQVQKDIISLPKKIMDDANAAVSTISTLGLKIPLCASSKIKQCKNDGTAILKPITTCVAKKMVKP